MHNIHHNQLFCSRKQQGKKKISFKTRFTWSRAGGPWWWLMDVDDVCQSWRCKAVCPPPTALERKREARGYVCMYVSGPTCSGNITVILHQPCVLYCKSWAVGVGTGTGAGSGKWNGSIGLRSGIPRRHAVRLQVLQFISPTTESRVQITEHC